LFKCIFSSSSIKISQTRIVQINSSLLTIDNMKQLALVTMAVIIKAGLPAWQVYSIHCILQRWKLKLGVYTYNKLSMIEMAAWI